jgi:autotransporter-associated beta strand protein
MKPSHRLLLSSALAFGLSPVLHAQSVYWNPDPLTNTWDAISTHWAATSGGTPASAWNPGDTAIFDQTATYTVTMSGSQAASTFQFSNGAVTLDLGGNSQTLSNLTITAPSADTTAILTNGSLTLDGANDLVITPGVTTGGRTALLDVSALSTLTISKAANNITVGGHPNGAVPGNYGTVRLSATTNSITAASVNVGTTSGANAGGVLNRGELYLGESNTISTNNWTLGNTRDSGLVQFQDGLTNPSVTLRATDGTSRVTKITIGQNGAGSTTVGTSHFNLGSGSVDALINELVISRGFSTTTTTTGPAVNGSFSMGGGNLDATTIWLSKNEAGGRNTTNTSSFNQSAGTVTVSSLVFGETTTVTGTPTFNSQYTLDSGELRAGEIKAGSGTFNTGSIRRINFNGGTITHYDASTDLLVNGVTGTGGSIGIALGTSGSPTIHTATGRTVTLGSFTSISGAGSLWKTGSGQLIMNNPANTATGGQFRPYEGAVDIGATNALAGLVLVLHPDDTSTISFTGTTVVAIGGLEGSRDLSVLNNVAATQDLTIGSAGGGNYTGKITGVKSIRKVGAGTQTYNPGSHTTSLVGLNVSGGTLELNSGDFTVTGNAAPSAPDSISGFIVSRGGTFRMNGANITATGGSYVITAGNTLGGGNNFILDSGTFDGGNREVLNSFGGSGTFTINDGLFIGGEFRISQSATGIVNLNGGTLRVTNMKYSNADAIVNFNGGTLQAKANRADFITTSVTSANIKAGGAIIDSNGFNITIPKIMTEDSGSTGGGLTKIGSGSLTLTANNSYTGPTLVNDGSLIVNADHSGATGPATVGDGIGAAASAILGGTGTIGGAITVAADGAIAPGTSVGNLVALGNVSGTGSVRIEIDGATADSLTLQGGTLDISSLTLDISELAAPTEPVYVIVNADSAISGAAFAAVNGVPAGYSVAYNHDDGVDTHNIALVADAGSPFTNWATVTNGLAGNDALPEADPDDDGFSNLMEFVIGGQPNPANPGANSSGLAPTIDTDENNLIFTFRRTALSATQPGMIVAAEYGSSLAGWTTAVHGVNGITIVPTEDHYGDGIDRIVVTIPKALAVGDTMFARLRAFIP